MNIKYFYEFKGLDNISNRVEILCNEPVNPTEITASSAPFVLEYPEVKKLEAIQGSGATLGLISRVIFQFKDLHTDNMQDYMIKFYRNNSLYWLGWMDSEMYSENLSSYPPYEVEFSASDFNILERIKFRNNSGYQYLGIDTLLTQLMRALEKLNLPFSKIYIGCSTLPNGVSLNVGETILHKLYIASSNFYDEDNEPMSCRDVVNSVLEPFGLMILQRDANIYVYDYNTIVSGGVMKCYNFSDLSYIGDTLVNVTLGDLGEIGFSSTNSTFGFEEMINNVEINSSLYAKLPFLKQKIDSENLSNILSTEDYATHKKELFGTCEGWEDNNEKFVKYADKNSTNNTIIGAVLPYNYNPSLKTSYTLRCNEYIINSGSKYMLNLKARCYVNTKNNPFNTSEQTSNDERAQMGELYCNLYIVDENGVKLKYYDNRRGLFPSSWIDYGGNFEQGKLCLRFCNQQPKSGVVLNNWFTNSNVPTYMFWGGFLTNIKTKDSGTGLNISLNGISGRFVLEITNKFDLVNPYTDQANHFPLESVKEIICNDVEMTIVDQDGNEVKPLDYEFKSYVNKNVASDFETKDLKVVSSNEDMIPTGRGCILKSVNDTYELQLQFTRNGQTDILERLLMCTIHSNYTTKNQVITADINMTDNPSMQQISYQILGSSKMIVTGCKMDFSNSTTYISAIDFSKDTATLSSIPYD